MISDTFFIGEKERIAIFLNNAIWYNKLTEEPVIPKRASTKEEIQKWLQDRKINFPEKLVEAQSLQLVCANCPPKEYIVSHFLSAIFSFPNPAFPLCFVE